MGLLQPVVDASGVSFQAPLIFVFKKFHDLEMGVKGHSRSLRVVSFNRLCVVSY